MVEGAYSLICMTPEGMIACRDPLGIRPLVMGKLGDATVFASETVALDVVGAEFVRQIEPGELVAGRLRRQGHQPPPVRPRAARARASSSTSISAAPIRSSTAARSTRCASRSASSWPRRRRSRPTWSSRCPTAACPRRSAMPSNRASRSSSASSARTTSGAPSSSRRDGARHAERQAQAQRQPRAGRGQAHRADRRFDRARHHLDEDRRR